MACECLKNVKEVLTHHVAKLKKVPEGRIIEGKFTGESLVLKGCELKTQMIMPFTLRYRHVTNAGKEIERKAESFLSLDFCPWCGKKYEEA